jgi:hypothetical protein
VNMKCEVSSISSVPDHFELSPGEIHFLWWFIQGSIMNPSTRKRLRGAWGMCERHAWGWMVVEAAFRSGYMHGPAVLYEDVMRLAFTMFGLQGPMQTERLKRRLSARGPCLMCEEGYGRDSQWFVKPHLVAQGRDSSEFRALAKTTFPYWREAICGICAGTGAEQRCRKHLIEGEQSDKLRDVSKSRELVSDICHHLAKYARSFQFEYHGTQTEEDTASLISAVGWCCGWGILLSIVGEEDLA